MAYILIVEDEPILYERLRRFLVKENFNVAEYTNSFEDAINSIKTKSPDLALLDINLVGDKDGIDLGEELFKTYKIPFIYVTDFADEVTFNRALRTNPTIFEVKTKPNLDTEHLLRSIKIALNNNKCKTIKEKKGLMVYVDYLDKIKLYGKSDITRVPIAFKDIAFITTENFKDDNGKLNTLRYNYVRLETINNYRFFYKSSLKNIIKIVPINFIRINESTIVNISLQTFNGRVNGTRLVINNQQFTIKDTYAKEVKNRIDIFYQD